MEEMQLIKKEKTSKPKTGTCCTMPRYKSQYQLRDVPMDKENAQEFITLHDVNDLVTINFGINDKCCICGQNLITRNMESFLFYEYHGVYSDEPCEYIHYGCKISMRVKPIIDIEMIYNKLNLDYVENEDKYDDALYIEI
jgi:hypothetical protein